ncbi:hypothetical protein ABFS82_06G128700 [Erythranthe guttata]|uniref:Guanylyl cyclase n=1 Tax=Erythranthe guttata TaxID=4155 RepID=A0A022R8Q3_ERYGU|nr:PREDICTED: protein GUCD1 [Erythranthe guttata]XP_012840052.1 PREDICTED: protein GUCD1 [Erythranthe guttata]EYU35265.1 hypothetical protein MIMGU_mgv1a011515mg [Erythranthe guttata]|eukprot:XP_012840051.1 PREDICTED: protein GUCD1 [Erythranthe guttata]
MWSINLIMNKLLKAYEENFDWPAGDHFHFVESYSIEKSSSNKEQSRTQILSHFIEVPHINQQHSWDCGLACVLMVLRLLGVYDCNIQQLCDLCSTTSIWTVDLAYLLHKFSVSFTYCTVTLGGNPDFSVETFYKDQLPNDLLRVNTLFHEAREAGICIECRSVSAKEISGFILSGKYVAIALVDQDKLWSDSQLVDGCVSDFYSCSSPGYTGHYIVICGYDALTNEFEIRDPASSRKIERVTSWCLEQAHKSFGTDEDLLLISVDKGGDRDNLVEFFSL